MNLTAEPTDLPRPWRRHLRSGLGLKSRGAFAPPQRLTAPPAAALPPRPAGKIATFLAKPPYIVFAWTFGVLMAAAAAYAYIDISQAVAELEAEGNPFANLLWSAMSARLVNDGIVVAMIAGVVAIIAAVSNRKR